jgi:hypothetical protein
MIFSRTLSKYLVLKNNKNINYKNKFKVGFYFYPNKSKAFSNENYFYFAYIFDLVTSKNPSISFVAKNYKTKAFLNCNLARMSLDFYNFFSLQYLKHYPSENVSLFYNEKRIQFLTKNHILIFKNLSRYDMELYEDRFDEPFVFFVEFGDDIDLRILNIIC